MAVVAYCLQSLLAGALAGLISVGGLLFTDVGSIRVMMLHDPSGWIALSLLILAFVTTFGLAAIGNALTEIGRDDPGKQ